MIERECTALCGAIGYWQLGQEWLRCGQCGTLQWWPGGATDSSFWLGLVVMLAGMMVAAG